MDTLNPYYSHLSNWAYQPMILMDFMTRLGSPKENGKGSEYIIYIYKTTLTFCMSQVFCRIVVRLINID